MHIAAAGADHMSWYRVYFLNGQRRICDVAEFRSPSNETALQHGRKLLQNRPYFCGIELWQENRPVFIYPSDHLATEAAVSGAAA